MYPVRVEYPDAGAGRKEDVDYVDAAAAAVDDLAARAAGDVLVFMPTEQDILETCEILEEQAPPRIPRFCPPISPACRGARRDGFIPSPDRRSSVAATWPERP